MPHSGDLNDSLTELSNWQKEQLRRLQDYEESHKKLLEYGNIGQQCVSNKKSEMCINEIGNNITNGRTNVFQLQTKPIVLREPQMETTKSVPKPVDLGLENLLTPPSSEENMQQPRRFLRRGDGLARFRMTKTDYVGPPKIYTQNKIKTYFGKEVTAPLKNINKEKKKKVVKKGTIPVKFYTSENSRKPVAARPVETKPPAKRTREVMVPKVPVREMVLQPSAAATTWYNAMREREKKQAPQARGGRGPWQEPEAQRPPAGAEERGRESAGAPAKGGNSLGLLLSPDSLDRRREIERQLKEEKELRNFEALEERVDDLSFCSSGSLVAKLLNDQLTSPEKQPDEDNEDTAEKTTQKHDVAPVMTVKKIVNENNETIGVVESSARVPEQSPCGRIERPQLMQYMKNFQQFKSDYVEQGVVGEEDDTEDPGTEPEETQAEDRCMRKLTQHEIAQAVQRKALQDNVKLLLTSDMPPPCRRKPVKKVVTKKVKPKPKKVADAKEKIVFSGALLKERLDELEKEIGAFRKANRQLEKSQKECDEIRMKLERDRKDFEKYALDEKQKMEEKFAEEQKKLQRDKNVFERYCKQVKSQPNRQEREEISSLRKEVEKLNESVATKEARWGASQARLRNQNKALERQTKELKAELDKMKRQTVKRVTFEREQCQLNKTQMMHLIGSELSRVTGQDSSRGVPASVKYKSLSARVDSNLKPKPIRRINSVPNMKTNAIRAEQHEEAEHDDAPEEREVEDANKSQEESMPAVSKETKSSCTEEAMEEAASEALFGQDLYLTTNSAKVLEIKRRLRRLEQLGCLGSEEVQPRRDSGDTHDSGCELTRREGPCDPWGGPRGPSPSDSEEEGGGGEEPPPPHRADKSPVPQYVIETGLGDTAERPRELLFQDGRRELHYPNGKVKRISADGTLWTTYHLNGDVLESNKASGIEKYFHAETKTRHTKYSDGLEILEFANGQMERRRPDGSTDVSFPNGCVRYRDPAGHEEWRFKDGTVVKTNPNGDKVMLMASGQKETHTKDCKSREYPDGTVKKLYPDGRQETIYALGRVRLKDSSGKLLMDTGGL